jgi:hypothetical protein
VWSAHGFEPNVDGENCRLSNAPPHYPTCDQMARPNVLMIGDPYWEPWRSEGQRQREEKWLRTIDSGQRTVVIEIGADTTIPSVSKFQPAHQLRIWRAAHTHQPQRVHRCVKP